MRPTCSRPRTPSELPLWALVPDVKRYIERTSSPHGYNIGVNVGAAAGQTVAHAHLHIIPRYAQDVADPRGGVRWVIPARAAYWQDRDGR